MNLGWGGGQALVQKRGQVSDGGGNLTKFLPDGGDPPVSPREKTLQAYVHNKLNLSAWMLLPWGREMNYSFNGLNALYSFVIFKGKDIVCDTINRNESHVGNIKFWFFQQTVCPFKMLYFNPNPISIGYLVAKIWAILWSSYNNVKL